VGGAGGLGGGGGHGGEEGGGGGLGAGGGIFVMAGASLTIEGGSLGTGTVSGGLGASGGGNGQAFGGGMFLQGDETIALAPASGTVETISGVIADQTGSGGTGANAGAGGLILNGAGTLDLAAVNTFTGGVTIDKGALELANSAAAGSGKISFATGAGATLKVNNGVFAVNPIAGFAKGDTVEFLGNGSAALASPSSGGAIDMSPSGGDEAGLLSGIALGATISGFGSDDTVDFDAVGYASTDRVTYASGVVSIDNSTGAAVASFDVIGTYTAANFTLSAEPSGGNLVVGYAATPIAAAFDFAAPPLTAPEPSTWAMMALGFAALAFAGYRGSLQRRLRLGRPTTQQ
jgi:autotransporter-associated beta strand protein